MLQPAQPRTRPIRSRLAFCLRERKSTPDGGADGGVAICNVARSWSFRARGLWAATPMGTGRLADRCPLDTLCLARLVPAVPDALSQFPHDLHDIGNRLHWRLHRRNQK